MAHRHTPEDNAMLAEAYLDFIGGKWTEEQAKAGLSDRYSHRPSLGTVGTYWSAAGNAHQDFLAGVTTNNRRWKYSQELYKQMGLAIAKRRPRR